MTHPRLAIRYLGYAVLLSVAGVAWAPGRAAAQDTLPDRDRWTDLARTHLALDAAREEFQGIIARVHDDEGRRRAREEFDAKVEGIFEEHGVAREEFDAFMRIVSSDADVREEFEALLAELREGGGGGVSPAPSGA
jgi:hypothetical protein